VVGILDYTIIIAYLIIISIVGSFSGGRQKSAKDYFLGSSKVPWWAVCFSIVAAETSSLTFISIPGLAYLTNLSFLQVTFGYLIGRIFVAYFLLPAYFKGDLSTAYAFLENRFGGKTRKFASVVFLFTRVAADGVRLFATAIPLKLMLNISYPLAIIIIAVVALMYTYLGGVKGIIWVDAIQMFIYLSGAIIAVFVIAENLTGGISSIISFGIDNDKFHFFNTGFNLGFDEFIRQPYTIFSGIIGGAFLSMASHGVDQLVVQRLLATKELKSAQKAIIGSGVIVVIQFAIFLFVGIGLYTYYSGASLDSLSLMKADEIFPKFIIEKIPAGLSGLIIAGLFAAALSTLAGSISSLSSSAMLDLYKPLNKNIDSAKELKLSRFFSVFWSVLLIFSALFFMNSPSVVVELALSIASFTYGGLLGTFLLGLLVKEAKQEDALAAFVGGIFVMITFVTMKLVGWSWYTLIGVITSLLIGKILSKFTQIKSEE
jgi:SSS family transporter